MGNAKYVGRVGALAVALGIGAAVAATPWVAVAEPSTDSSAASDSSPASESASKDDSKPATSRGVSRSVVKKKQTTGAKANASANDDVAADKATRHATDRKPATKSRGATRQAKRPQAEPVAAAPTEVTLAAPPSMGQADAVEKQLLPTAPARPAPAQSPLWGVLELARRQVRHTLFNRTPTVDYHPLDNSQLTDGVITGNLHAVDPDGDPLAFNVTQEPEHGTVVVNRDGTFTYTPDDEFGRIGSDSFTVSVDDSVAYRLAGPVGIVLDALHRGAQIFGLSGQDTINSHPTVKATPQVFIEVGPQPADVAVSPDGATAYVVNQGDNTVSVIDTATNTVSHTVAVGDNSVAVAASPDGSRVYVVNRFDDSVSVIDTATNTVTGTIPVGFLPGGLALSPNGTILYVANSQDQTVMKINTNTQTVVATISVVGFPQGVAVSPDGSRVYVTCEGLGGQQGVGTLAVIETTNNTVIGIIPVGEFFPRGVAVTPDGSRVYVANDDGLWVIDTASLTAITTVPVGAGAGVAVSPDGKRVYVANYDEDTMSVISTVSNTVTSTIAVGNSPRGVAVGSDGRIYVTNAGEHTLFVRG
ncbi:beta-propeller fold lactonase family protein [Mycobacterium sp. 3519A]|uniref:beta-propeller fold lactonase family protein n=1 Tax=Mycobacterium sp. 3519A TaxID=2057184 RepID=UPI000C7A7473|nr:beta-propeller fold lactonase family protein [Mycobacterium sp. 3519A]